MSELMTLIEVLAQYEATLTPGSQAHLDLDSKGGVILKVNGDAVAYFSRVSQAGIWMTEAVVKAGIK